MPEEPDAARELSAALGRTVSRRTARIELRHEFSFGLDEPPARRTRPRGGLPVRELIGRELLGVALRTGGRLVERWVRKKILQSATGFIDFETQRCRFGDPSHATTTLVVGDRTWTGPFGTAVEAASADHASTLQPLWLVDLVRGVVTAREQPSEILQGRTCRRFSAHADLNRAAEAVRYQLAIPTGTARLDELKRIPVELWVDDEGRIRRIRHAHSSGATPSVPPSTTTTVDLIEFDIELPADWSSLPSV